MQKLDFSNGKKLIQVSPFVPRAEVMGGVRGISDTGCNRNVKPWCACRKL